MTDCEGLNKEPITDVAIRFQDCDPFGHLNTARYNEKKFFLNKFALCAKNSLIENYELFFPRGFWDS